MRVIYVNENDKCVSVTIKYGEFVNDNWN